jgi:sulfite dehydrogenase (cytochrome) subunit B
MRRLPVRKVALLALATIALATALASRAQEEKVALKNGKGRDLVQSACALCHSLDYIEMNSVFLDRKGWEAEVTKMVKAFGLPLEREDQVVIIDYLDAQYGKK